MFYSEKNLRHLEINQALAQMALSEKLQLKQYMSQFVSPGKWQKIQKISQERTRHMSVVLEDIFQAQNASAVLRTCDGLGIQNVYLLENRNFVEISTGVTLNVDQWMSLKRYTNPAPPPFKTRRQRLKEARVRREQGLLAENYDPFWEGNSMESTKRCVADLKAQGYTLVATSPHEKSIELEQIPLDQPLALMFGSEKQGLSPCALELADCFVSLPMFGFSESFNLSVTAAMCLSQLMNRLRQKPRASWALSENDLAALQIDWLRISMRDADSVLAHYLEKKQH